MTTMEVNTHLWNRLLWRKIILAGPVDKTCPRCAGLTTGSVVFQHRRKGHGHVYLLPCWHWITPEEGDAL